jgi:hypothetical protein
MKRCVSLLALSLLSPMAAHAACAATDFAIQDVKAGMMGSHVMVAGKLTNHCAMASAAQLEVDAKDSSGNVVATKRGWPAGTTNIAPEQSVTFDLGRLLHPQAEMATYTITVVDVRAW